MVISIKEALDSFGLSSREQSVYLANLELGTTTANKIAEKSKLNRSTTYDILRDFLKKGLASKIEKNGITNFDVASPAKLIDLLNEKKIKLESVLPQLKLIEQRITTKPIVKVFEGLEGMKTILADIIETKVKTDVISTSKVFNVMKFYFPNYIKERAELKLYARVIQEDSKETNSLKLKDKSEFRETRSLKNFNSSSMVFIYENKVATIKLVENEVVSILIQDETLANDQRQVFEILWNNAK
ncbi:MAG: helix-turn-helix domain-containing protein [Candidatus Woesearchaeota archaeon]|jgi:sugar-specific transcriptional regulator TrmB